MGMELIKENIEYEQILGENTADTVLKAEYVIPDTQPDVFEIIMLDAKPNIISKEVIQDKVYVEGQVVYNVMYLSKIEDENVVYSVSYSNKFSSYIDIEGAMHEMDCEVDCFAEHIECSIVNERKIALEGIIKVKALVVKNCQFEIIKDIEGFKDVQLLKNPTSIDKIVGIISADLVGKSHTQIPMDNPEIGFVLRFDANLYKKDVKIFEGKIQVETYANIQILYRDKDSDELQVVSDDVLLNKEIDMPEADPTMISDTDFVIEGIDYSVKENDLGENRIIDTEILVKSKSKIICKKEIDMIEDAYSPVIMMNMDKKNYELNAINGQSKSETIVKENIEIPLDMPQVSDVIISYGRVYVTDKKLMEDKVSIEGLLNIDVLYKSDDEEKPICKCSDEIPFTCLVEVPGCKIDMNCRVKTNLESLETSVEADTIAVKAVISIDVNVSYTIRKEFLIDINLLEGETPMKKASVTIYVVQQGDTMWKIAKKYCVTIDNLIKLNNIENPDYIVPGQKLLIPGRAVI